MNWLAFNGSKSSTPWKPSSWKSFTTFTPFSSINCTNSLSRSTNGSPLLPLTNTLQPSSLIFSNLWTPFPALTLQYSWSRSAPVGSANSHIESATHRGRNGLLASLNSDSVLCTPPKNGWRNINPWIFTPSRSFTSSTARKPARKQNSLSSNKSSNLINVNKTHHL